MLRVSALLERTHLNQFPIFLLIMFSSIFLMQCTEGTVAPDFGSPYEVIIDSTPGAPESPPRLAGEWLLVKIAYTGGCADHKFELERDVRRDTVHVWLKHSIPAPETCSDTINDDLSIELPLGIYAHHTIALHIPPGGPPYMLKWRRR